MASDIPARDEFYAEEGRYDAGESRFSAVSWGAIIAGGVGAAAMALVLMTLGVGLGLIAVSPWRHEGASPAAIGTGVIIWSIVVHAISFGLGGYLTGRLRTKWASIGSDEVYFRDTAHGFVTWGLGMLVSFCILTSLVGAVARGSADVAAAGAGSAGIAGAVAASQADTGPEQGPSGSMTNPVEYFSDRLFRPAETPSGTIGDATGSPALAPAANPADSRAEAGRILLASLGSGEITPADRSYLARMISQSNGMPQPEAEARVDEIINEATVALDSAREEAKKLADDARKAGIGWALWTFIAMLIGAFCASFAATVGGRARDL